MTFLDELVVFLVLSIILFLFVLLLIRMFIVVFEVLKYKRFGDLIYEIFKDKKGSDLILHLDKIDDPFVKDFLKNRKIESFVLRKNPLFWSIYLIYRGLKDEKILFYLSKDVRFFFFHEYILINFRFVKDEKERSSAFNFCFEVINFVANCEKLKSHIKEFEQEFIYTF